MSDADIRSDASLGELFGRMSSDLSTLVRKEMELAKVETKEEISKVGKAGSKLGAAAFTGYLAVLFVSFAIVHFLDNFMQLELSFFIVAAIYGIAAAVLASRGRDQLKTVNPVPEETVQTLKEDVQWAKTHNS